MCGGVSTPAWLGQESPRLRSFSKSLDEKGSQGTETEVSPRLTNSVKTHGLFCLSSFLPSLLPRMCSTHIFEPSVNLLKGPPSLKLSKPCHQVGLSSPLGLVLEASS